MPHTKKAHMVVFSDHFAPLLLVLQVFNLPLAMRKLSFQVSLYVGWYIVGFCESSLDVSSALLDFIQGLARRSAAGIIARTRSVVFELLPLLESSVTRGSWCLDFRVCPFRTHVGIFLRILIEPSLIGSEWKVVVRMALNFFFLNILLWDKLISSKKVESGDYRSLSATPARALAGYSLSLWWVRGPVVMWGA